MGKRKKYTEGFRNDAVRLMLARGTRTTIAEVAEGLGLDESMLSRWHERYGGVVNDRAAVSQHERKGIEKMRRQLRELEQKDSLPKTAAALFTMEMKQPPSD